VNLRNHLRFAVIGCGRMGLRRMQSLVDNPRAELLWAVDVKDSARRTAAARHGCDTAARPDEAINDPAVDGVVVSVPNKWHRDIVLSALRRKKHVFCEKPLGRDTAEARAMLAAAERSRVTLKVGSNLRYFPNVLKAKRLYDAGAVGRPLFLRSWIGHNGWTQDGWYAVPRLSGGGPLLDNGAHLFDLLRWFLGEPVDAFGAAQPLPDGRSRVEDNAMAVFHMKNGALASVHASWTQWAGYMRLELGGTRGALRIENSGPRCETVLVARSGKEKVFDFSSQSPNSYQAEMDDYLARLLRKEQPRASGWDGLRAVQMARAVYRSALTGRRVRIEAPPR